MLSRCKDCLFFVVPDGGAIEIGTAYPCHRNPPIAVPVQLPESDGGRKMKINIQVIPMRPVVAPMDLACGEFKNV